MITGPVPLDRVSHVNREILRCKFLSTLRENTDSWTRLKLYYHVLTAVETRDLRTSVLGKPISMPVVVAPTAFHKLACETGEIATAHAAKAAGTLFILSSLSNTAMESV